MLPCEDWFHRLLRLPPGEPVPEELALPHRFSLAREGETAVSALDEARPTIHTTPPFGPKIRPAHFARAAECASPPPPCPATSYSSDLRIYL